MFPEKGKRKRIRKIFVLSCPRSQNAQTIERATEKNSSVCTKRWIEGIFIETLFFSHHLFFVRFKPVLAFSFLFLLLFSKLIFRCFSNSKQLPRLCFLVKIISFLHYVRTVMSYDVFTPNTTQVKKIFIIVREHIVRYFMTISFMFHPFMAIYWSIKCQIYLNYRNENIHSNSH